MNLYAYVNGNPVNFIDSEGLCRKTGESGWDCADRVAHEALGDKLDILDGFGYWGISSKALVITSGISQYSNVTLKISGDYIKNANIAGALKEGDILTKISASKKAAQNAINTAAWRAGLSTISKWSGILGLGASGGSAAMRALGYYYGDCDKECSCEEGN
jgi:hypothetical protein